MADNQAMGAALYTIGQGISDATGEYFGGQIKAAQNAQDTALKAMQLKAETEQKQNALAETTQYHTADLAQKAAAEKDRQQEESTKEKNTELFQQGELGLRGQEVGLRGQEVSNAAAHQKVEETQGQEKIDIDRAKATDTDKKAIGADKAGETLAAQNLKTAQETLKKLVPDGVDPNTLPASVQSKVAAAQQDVNSSMERLAAIRKKLSGEGALNMGPLTGTREDVLSTEGADANIGVAPATNPKAPKPAGNATVKAPANIPSAAVTYLQQHDSPELRQMFDQKYGQGSASSVLGE